MPAVPTYWPGWQVVQAPHAAAFVVVLNVPEAQLEHTRLAVLLPTELTNWPV